MNPIIRIPPKYLDYGQTLVVLGRPASLPTVWSHSLAGWWLGGGGGPGELLALWLGVTFLYLGGAFLRDACDAEHDAVFRRKRPIPSGAIELRTVWLLSLTWLGLGFLILMMFGRATALLALLLSGVLVLFNAAHRIMVLSPLLLTLARFLIYLLGASTAAAGLVGLAIWSGLALAFYAAGVHFVARKHPPSGKPLAFWPIPLLAAPLLLAWLVNGEGYRWAGFWVSLLVVLWMLLCLRSAYGAASHNLVHVNNGLIAGMILVDFLAVAPETLWLGAFFAPLFLAALLMHRLQPLP